MADVVAGEASARSVQGASGGLCLAAVDVTPEAFTVTEWKGRYVTIQAVGDTAYYVFSAASASGGLDIAATASDSASTDATVPEFLGNGERVRVMVPDLTAGRSGDNVYLLVRSASATTADIRVRAS